MALRFREHEGTNKTELQIRLQRFPWPSGFYGTLDGREVLPALCTSGVDVTHPQDTRGYCLSVADDFLVLLLLLRTVAQLDSLVGGEGGKKKKKKKNPKRQTETDDVVLVLAAEGAGQQCGAGDARSPPDSGMFQ